MINWIIGGIIFGSVIGIIVRTVVRMRKGTGSCCCGECTESKCDCVK